MCRLRGAYLKGKFCRFGHSRSEGSKRGSCSSWLLQRTGTLCFPKTLTQTMVLAPVGCESVPEIKYLQCWGKLFPGCDEIKNTSFSVGLFILPGPWANLILAEFWAFPAFIVGLIQVTGLCSWDSSGGFPRDWIRVNWMDFIPCHLKSLMKAELERWGTKTPEFPLASQFWRLHLW